jgi:APA family basic amino acid/polyamine antiporter
VFTTAVEKMIDYTIFLDSIAFVFSSGTIFILRRRRMGEDRDIYRMKGYPWMPLFFMLAYASVTVSITLGDPMSAVYCLLIFLCFFILYFILKWTSHT